MTNVLNKKIPKNISEKRECKRQTNLKNPKNIFSTGDVYCQ